MVERQWHAVYTRPGKEKRVAKLLTKKKIKNYLPLNKIERQEGRSTKSFAEPLFPGYVFLCLNANEQENFYQSADIINFVYWLNKPAVIKEDEIIAMSEFLDQYASTRIEKVGVNAQQHLEMISEPQMSRKGNVLEVATATVKLRLPSLGHMLVTEIRKETVEETVYTGGAMLNTKVA